MKKPVRQQPTPEQIAVFEETGRAGRKLDPALLDAQPQISVDTENRQSVNTEWREPVSPDSRKAAPTPPRKAVNTETQKSVGPIKRLTVDLPESAHLRFKVACALAGQSMVDEVRDFIERRTRELEGQQQPV